MKTRKIIRLTFRVLIALLILFLLALVIGDIVINRYINADGRRDLSKYLPINGTATFDHASIHPFRDFPHLTLKMKGLRVADSLADEHNHPPVVLEELDVRVSLEDWSKKQIAIQSIGLKGLTVNLFDATNGYSNIADLIRKQITEPTTKKKKSGISVISQNTSVHISKIELNKIDEQTGQRARASIDEISFKNSTLDSLDVYTLALELNQIKVSELPAKRNAKNPIQLAQAIANVELNKAFSELNVYELRLANGHIHLYNDSLDLSNYSNLFGQKEKGANYKTAKKGGMSLAIDGAHIELDDIAFSMINHIKNRHLAARIVKLETVVQAPTGMEVDTTAIVDLELDVDQLAFNTKKGAYLKESIVRGQIETKISHQLIGLTCPELMINEDPFVVKANIFRDKKTPTTLAIEKQEAHTLKVLPLLTDGIQQSISQYDVRGPFDANAHIVFTPGKKDPRVEVNFQVENKSVIVKGQTLKNANVSATFVNRLYDDAQQFGEDRRNMRLMIHQVHGVFNELQIESNNALITSTPEDGARLKAKAAITGKASSASQYLKHDKFYFQEGKFNLYTDIDGSLDNMSDLIAGTNLNLAMEDLEVHYPAGNTVIPLRLLEMKKDGEKTIFEISGFTDNEQRPFRIQGEVDRVESLLTTGHADRLQTEANIRANSISWEGVVALFGEEGIFSSAKTDNQKQAKRSMKQTLSGIQQSFQPIVRIAIDTFYYGENIQLLDFQSGVKFDDERTLVLEETSFDIEEANVTLDGELKINELDFTRFDFDIELTHLDFDALMPKFDYFGVHLIKRIHDQPDNLSMQLKLTGELDDNAGLRPESINAVITYESFAEDKFSGRITLQANPATKKVDVVFGHSGHPRNFNYLLESDAYRFDKGWFAVSFQFADNFESIAQMVEESTFNLTIDDAEVYITELDVTVPLTRIEVASLWNQAFYHLLLRSDSLDQEIALDGTIKNVRHFAFKDTDEPYKIDLEISSARILWENLIQVIAYQQQGGNQIQNGRAIKESLTKVLNDFHPNVILKIDTLAYSDGIRFNDIYAHAYLDQNILKIDSTIVSYGESRFRGSLEAEMNHEDVLPFDLRFQLNNIDIGQTLEHFDYFNVDELREAEKIDGNIWFDLDMHAEMNLENRGFNTEKTDAEINVELKDLVVTDLQTINTISQRFKNKERFNDLHFAPIQTQIKLKGQKIVIKETEIKSNAIHAFVEGTLDKQSSENLWISLPIYNIKKPDLEGIPQKTGYAPAGKKVYLKWITSQDEDDGKVKFHLRKKKFFKERLKEKQFRAYKRMNRRERKRLRRERRNG